MVNLSIKKLNSSLVLSKRKGEAVPVIFVGDLSKPMGLISDNEISHMQMVGFDGSLGQKLIVPTSKGNMAKVFIGIRKKPNQILSKFFLGNVLSTLPEGNYSLRLLPKKVDLKQLILGFYFSIYNFKFSKGKQTNFLENNRVQLCEVPQKKKIKSLNFFVEAEYIVRDLINLPPNFLGPQILENFAKKFSIFHGTKFGVIKGKQLLEENLPLIFEVGKGSKQKPRLIKLDHGPKNAKLKIALIGKGVCFDSGGLNLKSSEGMRLMKKDMAGAAAVLGLGHYLLSRRVNIKLQILIPCVENMVSGNAYRPGDILVARTGKSIEIQNTDAEGRLIIADALALAAEEKPDILVSFASLTGAARVALGTDLTPFYSTDENLSRLLKKGGDHWYDPLWQMPFYEYYGGMLSSEFADLNNAPTGGLAGSITAALFLKSFTMNHKRFLHFDIFGWNRVRKPGRSVGGILQGARALAYAIEKLLKK